MLYQLSYSSDVDGNDVMGWGAGLGGLGLVKRVEGIEPSSLAWKAIALPLSYTRRARRRPAGKQPARMGCRPGDAARNDNGECRIRTCEGISHQIYSLTPLAAWVTPREVWIGRVRWSPVVPPPGRGQRAAACAGHSGDRHPRSGTDAALS